jgi:uncharacterized linocin/CFP29 family protein
MANKYLAREDAPIEAKTWEVLDQTMLEAAKSFLCGRRILGIEGPYGLGLKVVPLGDPELAAAPVTSPALPLALIQRSYTLARRDLAAYERDGIMLDARPVFSAAIDCARWEDEVIFKGTEEVPGLLTAEGGNELKISGWDEVGIAAEDIIKAATALDLAGFHGPYCLALAPPRYNLLLRYYSNGNLSELEHVKTIAAEGVYKAPVLENGGVLLASGRQYASIVLGQDMATGFIGPIAERLEFSISETLALFIRQPGAICVLKE